jgi:hypothetical protein
MGCVTVRRSTSTGNGPGTSGETATKTSSTCLELSFCNIRIRGQPPGKTRGTFSINRAAASSSGPGTALTAAHPSFPMPMWVCPGAGWQWIFTGSLAGRHVHHPAGELLVDRLLGIARQADGIGRLHKIRRRVVLAEQPGHPDREEVHESQTCISAAIGCGSCIYIFSRDRCGERSRTLDSGRGGKLS